MSTPNPDKHKIQRALARVAVQQIGQKALNWAQAWADLSVNTLEEITLLERHQLIDSAQRAYTPKARAVIQRIFAFLTPAAFKGIL